MNEQAYILISGRDEALLTTRANVLRTAGYHAAATLVPVRDRADLSEVGLLMICHTLNEDERRGDLSAFAAASSTGKALCFTPHTGEYTIGVATLDSYQGPREMLRVVNRLLTA